MRGLEGGGWRGAVRVRVLMRGGGWVGRVRDAVVKVCWRAERR